MDNEPEFKNKMAEMAVLAAAKAADVRVTTKGGFDYEVTGNSLTKRGISQSDLDDAIQQALIYLQSQVGSEPEKLADDGWVRQKLISGARTYIERITSRNKDQAAGETGSDGLGINDAPEDARPSRHPDADGFEGHPDEDEPDEPAAPGSPHVHYRDPAQIERELRDIKAALRSPAISGEHRNKLVAMGTSLEKELELSRKETDSKKGIGDFMARFNKPKKPVIDTPRKPISDIPDATPGASGYSLGHDDDDLASASDLKKYRRRMNAEHFNFHNYLSFKEMMGATGAIYTGKKSPDFQWQGDPKSMIKVRKGK
jgi:hypothetical protein